MVKSFFEQLSNARAIVAKYNDEQVKLVQQCYNEICHIISVKMWEPMEGAGYSISECKNDYMLEAIEDELLTEEEFKELFKAIEVIGTENAMAYA